MPRTRRDRTLNASPEDVWRVAADPHHLPRWWPRVQRVEAVEASRWTVVFATRKGKPVRADYVLEADDPPRRRTWTQELAESPFENLMDEAVTELSLEPEPRGTRVTLELRQQLRGLARLGWFMVARANRHLLDDALESLDRACAG